MRPDNRAKAELCPCCKVCTDCPGFQKILAVPDAGYVLYRHTTRVEDVNKETGALENSTHTVEDVFILEKTQGEDFIKIDVTPEIDRNKIQCSRCVNILKYAQKLIRDQDIGKNDVMGICQHCKNFGSTCVKCDETMEKFQSSKRAQKEIHSQRVKTWLSKIQKNIKLSLFSDRKGKQITRGYSDVDLNNLLKKIKAGREPEIEDLFVHDTCELYASKRGPGSEVHYFSKAKDKCLVFEEPKTGEDKQHEYIEMRKDFFQDDSLIPSIATLTEDDLEKDFIRKFGKSYKGNLKYISPAESKGFEQDDFIPVPEIRHKFEKKKIESKFYDTRRQSEIKSKEYEYETTKKDFGKSVSIDEPYERDARKLKKDYEEKEPKKYIPTDERIYEANRKKYGEEYAKAADQLPDKWPLAKDSGKHLERMLSSAAKVIYETPSRIRKYRSEESLLTDKTKMSDDIIFNETFDYYFPELIEGQKKLKVKKEVSSSELITDTLDKLRSKIKEGERKRAEAERIKEERRKRLEQEKKEREERIIAQQMAKAVEKMPNEQDVKSMRQVSKEKKLESSNIKKEEPKETQNKEKPVASTKLEKPKKKIEELKIKDYKPTPEIVEQTKPVKVKEEKPKPEIVEKPKPEKVKEEKPKPERVKEDKQKPEGVKEEKPKSENVKEGKSKSEMVEEDKPKLEKNKEEKFKLEKYEIIKQEKVKEEKVKDEKQKLEKNNKEKLKSEKDENIKQEKVKEEKVKDEKPKPEKNKEQKLKSEKDENIKQEKVKEEKVKNEKQKPENIKDEKLKSNKDEKDKQEKAKEEKVTEEKPRVEKAKDEKPKVDNINQDEKEHRMRMEQNRRDIEKQMQELKSDRDEARKARIEQKAKAQEEAEKKKQAAMPQQQIEVTKIKMKRPSIYDLIKEHNIKIPAPPKVMNIPTMLEYKRHMCKHGKKETGCAMCLDSDYDLEVQNILWEREEDEVKKNTMKEAVFGENIVRFKTKFGEEEAKDPHPPICGPAETVGPKTRGVLESETAKVPLKPDTEYGVLKYSLSDRTFIDKGWTKLPTEKVLRKINVYRMRPAHPEFDWFEHNKKKGQLLYDTGEKLAEIDENGRGRWFYRSGLLALDYYNAEEMNAQHRFVVYSSGEPDERGRTHPRSVLASFDYLGNGIVFDHTGKIRLKFNQTEGVILDRSLGPVSHWKWHSLNDPPVLQQVMIDTQMSHKDPTILNLGGPGENKPRVDDEAMLAIEFDNFIKEKSAKLTQTFKPFQIKMKALKINEYFSLRVLDQANVHLIYRDGKTNIKLNVGMILDHKEIVDTDTAELGEVSSNLERLPAKTDSLAELQRNIANAQKVAKARFERDRRVNRPQQVLSIDGLKKAASKPMKVPLITVDSSSGVSRLCKCRKPSACNVYYGTGFV